MKESFVFYETWAEAIRQMPDNERLQVYDAIMAYGIYGTKTKVGGLAQMALNLVYNDIDDSKQRRKEKAEKARESAYKRWQSQNTNASETMRTHANACERMRSDATQCYNVNGDIDVNVNRDVNSNIVSAEKSAPQPKTAKTIEEREADFMQKVADNGKNIYPDAMLRAFFNYWTEKNENGRKMRFEKEKVFDIKKRLATWASRESNNNFKSHGYGDSRNNPSSPDYVSTERIVAAGIAMAKAGM